MTERPTFSECVIGYRSWKLDDWVLSPVTYGHPWRPSVNTAKCMLDSASLAFTLHRLSGGKPAPKDHTAPHEDCSCGIHAYHDLPTEAEGIVVGAVAAWGDLQVHCNGFRAEHAQILALVEAPGLDEVAALYGVPLVPRSMLTMEAHQHGSPLPESMRPEKPKPVPATDLTSLYAKLAGSYLSPTSISWGMTTAQGYTRRASLIDVDLWTPADDVKAEAIDKEFDRLARYRKAPANRQGPIKPKRAPKNLGGAR